MTNPLILRAAETAARWHAGQKRKGAAAEPYVNHLLRWPRSWPRPTATIST